jgi:5-formyltetrahydrofolate cyclo-ligase
MEMRRRLAGLGREERDRASDRIRAAIGSDDRWRVAKAILGFVPLATEPDLLELLTAAAKEGRCVCVPRWNRSEEAYEAAAFGGMEGLEPGAFGVREPSSELPRVPWERLDLILVPGLAFDRLGRRLGRGRGYYDRILSLAPSARRWGVAFDCQIVETVPSERHDLNVHTLVTPEFGLTATQ